MPAVSGVADAADALDEFDAAAAALSARGRDASESSRDSFGIPRASRSERADSVASAGAAPADISRRIARRPRMLRKLVAASATAGVMGVAGLLAVSMTLPAASVAALEGTAPVGVSLVAAEERVGIDDIDDEEIQAFVASADLEVDSVVRSDEFSAVSLAEIAAEEGISYSASIFTNDPDASIQWPFVVGVPMSSGFGMRNGRLHEGIDLVPGAGAPIQAIADGTVRIATESGGAYGVTVYIDHVIDGQVVTSHYAHMQYGSLAVKTGDVVKVGDLVGKVGNTGRSYGAHLHFEIIINGSTIDPLPWMQTNAGRYLE